MISSTSPWHLHVILFLCDWGVIYSNTLPFSASSIVLATTLLQAIITCHHTMDHELVLYLISLLLKPSYLNWLDKPTYIDGWRIFLKHFSDYVLDYLSPSKIPHVMPSPAMGEEACKSWEPGRGWQVSPGATENLLSCGPWENSLIVIAGREAGRLPYDENEEWEKFCPVHLLLKETKPWNMDGILNQQ